MTEGGTLNPEPMRYEPDPQVRPFMPNFMRRMHDIRPSDVSEADFHETFTPLYDRYLIDHGLQKKADYMHGSDLHQAEPVHMLGRSGLITHLEEMNKDFNLADFGIPEGVSGIHLAILDIAQLRNMNYAEAGDYGLNRVAAKLQEKVNAINADQKKVKGGELAVGRIGGDEFMLVNYGMTLEKAQELFKDIINPEDGVTSVSSFYKDAPDPGNSQQAEVRNVALKEEPFVSIPTDEKQAEVMWRYLHQGIILEPEQIERILEHERTSGAESRPAHVEGTVTERLDRIVVAHPELVDISAAVQEWSARSELAGGKYTKEEILTDYVDFVEGVVYDRLLGENVRSIDDLNIHASAGDLSEMFVFDFKGVKEFNDYVSLVDGDHAIQATFKSVSDIIRKTGDGEVDETDNVIYFRRGGTIVVAGRLDKRKGGGAALSETKRQALKNVQTTAISTGNTSHSFDLGVTYDDQLHRLAGEGGALVAKETGSALQNAEEDWYGKMADELVNLSSEEILGADVVLPQRIESIAALADKPQLMKLFFHGKRRRERLTTLQRVVLAKMNTAVETSKSEEAVKLFSLAGNLTTMLVSES